MCHGRVHTSVWLHNLTRDYKTSTELMSKAMGSAVSLTRERGGEGVEGKKGRDWPEGGMEEDRMTAGGGWGETGGPA